MGRGSGKAKTSDGTSVLYGPRLPRRVGLPDNATFVTGGENEPELYAISEEDGSAYYIARGDWRFAGSLCQVPLRVDDTPDFDVSDPGLVEAGFYGGGEVDWDGGFEDDEDRERVKRIRDALAAELEKRQANSL